MHKVERAAMASGVEVHALFRLAEGVAQQQGEKDAEKCWGEDTALFNTALGQCPSYPHGRT